jgi:1-hydroxycarotenoid 3,4-desaturase
MAEHKVIVIGAGIGGLTAALELGHLGLDVTVIERGAVAGGKVAAEWVQGQPIDSGPTVFTMRWVFDELLDSVGLRLDRELKLKPLNTLARHFWADGSSLDLHADPLASEAAIEAFAGAQEAENFRKFCDTTRALYGVMDAAFIRAQRQNLPRFMASLGPRGLALLTRMGPMKTLWSSLQTQFTDPRLRQLFARYATYCGSSPWQAPATLSLIAQVEMDGVWSVEGGMVELAQCLTRLCQQAGVRFRFQTHCEQITLKNGKVSGVQLDTQEQLPADRVIFNGDAAALRQGLLGAPAQKAVTATPPQRSLSAVTWALHAKTQGLALDRHNLFFWPDYASEFQDIFERQQLPKQPTVYLCAQDRQDQQGPAGPERLLCLVNAPATGDQQALSDQALAQCESQCLTLMQQCGLSLELTPHNHVVSTPQKFHHRFPATGGALYGQATHGWMSIFSRPGAQSAVPGLYLSGGSVHPGPGVPMAAMSGRLAAAAVRASLGLTKSFPVGATSGGMSTP